MVMNDKKNMILVTHSGSFHADDVFAYAVLMELFSEHELIRSRNKEDWEKGDIVFDVGGGEFDHHSVDKIYRDNGIPYASFGLIWRKYGKEYLTKWFSEDQVEEAHKQIDEFFVQAIDAFDNGVNLIENTPVKVHTVSDIVGSFNNLVDAFAGSTPDMISFYQDQYFVEATKVAKQLLENEIWGIANQFRAKKTVQKAFEERTNKALVVLSEGCSWEDALWELDKNEEVLFVVYPKPDGHYIQVMRKDRNTFNARKDLPEEWAGKRDEELSGIIGIPDAIFCHPARFLAGAKSKESILKMAEIALAE
ncbi:metal-dependent hydrolase [Bacillus sp. M6-12]|uniref:MYG1 family protein n=1 Tax=Bacillus sp. M6-12 TaxID=2054166 RepID=UPI000C75C88A|nr:MYG1 family protein [Bacillus sp. M6-12]PLS18981.1 metal-dependent hydrolase [Bacillus sp. M6-12]